MSEELEKEIVNDVISNRYELADWIYKDVKKKFIAELEEIKKERKNLKNYMDYKTNELRRYESELNNLRDLIKRKEESLILHDRALNDRTNNLQKIYEKMLAIETRLKPFEIMGDMIQTKLITHKVEFEEPVEKESTESIVYKLNLSDTNIPKFILVRLSSRGVQTIGDLMGLKEIDLLKIHGLGKKKIDQINEMLFNYNLKIPK